MNARGLGVLLLTLAACSGDDGQTDASVPPCPTHDGASFVLGTGESTFEPLTEGQELTMAQGPQGGCHFWMSVRTDGFAERRLNVAYDVVYADTGTTTGSKSSLRVRLQRVDSDPALCEYVGLTAFLIEPWKFEDETVRLEVTLTDDEGRTSFESRTVVARWPEVPPGPDRDLACGPRN